MLIFEKEEKKCFELCRFVKVMRWKDEINLLEYFFIDFFAIASGDSRFEM